MLRHGEILLELGKNFTRDTRDRDGLENLAAQGTLAGIVRITWFPENPV